MWTGLAVGVATLLAVAEGVCDSNTLFFGDLNLQTLPPNQLPIVSAVGTYVLEPNNVSLIAYKHIGRPDQFLIQEPSAAPTKFWVVATLPDNKKPAEVQHKYEAWPEKGNILAQGQFGGEPWAEGAGKWEVSDCAKGRIPVPSLSLSCVAKTFGQCATDRWQYITPDSSSPDVLVGSDKQHSNGRREYHSPSRRIYVGDDGRWRLQSKGNQKTLMVSTTTAERLEYVRGWKEVSNTNTETDTDKKIECEPLRAAEGSTDPCANNPCKNKGTCISVEGSTSAYHCRCHFDSVSPSCLQVRECRVPRQVANAELIFTSDLAPQGKAFYRCDVGYYVNGTAKNTTKPTNSAFAVCDGSDWQNIPSCAPITTKVTIEAAYVHHCNFDSGWCDGYQHHETLSLKGRTKEWMREKHEGDSSNWLARSQPYSSPRGGKQLAILRTPCMFLPTDGCLAIDVRVDRGTNVTITDVDEVTLWRTSQQTDGFTTATLTLPPGSNRLAVEVVMGKSGGGAAVDNIRVFQWNCEQVTKLLFPKPRSSRAPSTSVEATMSLLSLVALIVYSRITGVLSD